jgi:branched-chain amino acid transport system substrate-binding protein
VGSVVLAADETVAARRDVVYGLFGATSQAGWLFAADCDVLAVGSVVSLQLPVGGPQAAVDMLGRVTALVPPRQIVIALDQPWRGRLRVCLERTGAESTRVSVRAEVDERGVEWLLRRRGWPAHPPADDGDYRIGLLTSKSGPGAVFAVACENLAMMAVDELNADGGLHGRRVRLLAADDATDPATGATEARWLLRAGCRVVLASVTSATFAAVQRAIGDSGVPLVHTVLNEGGGGPGHVFRWGERPSDQLAVAAVPLMRASGARHWFLVGDDYSWSHGAHRAARQVLPQAHGTIVGERFVPLGTKDFAPVIDTIARSGADLVLSTLVGADEVAFERQCLAMGLRARCRTLSLVLDESTRERIGDTAAAGLWTAFGYFQQLPTAENRAFLARYRETFGPWAPPVSTLSESAYSAVHLYGAAARQAREDDPGQVAAVLRRLRAVMPRGSVELAGPHRIRQQLRLAEASAGGFQLLE